MIDQPVVNWKRKSCLLISEDNILNLQRYPCVSVKSRKLHIYILTSSNSIVTISSVLYDIYMKTNTCREQVRTFK